jgi:GDPmannose 4,6-dehydratase
MGLLTESLSKEDNDIHLVVGVNGQDGSFLAEALLARGRNVIGIARQKESRWVVSNSNFKYIALDLKDINRYVNCLKLINPSKIYHFAAIHGPSGFEYEANWLEAHTINTLVAHASLEHLRKKNPSGSFIYASSSKAFDCLSHPVISESAKRSSTCIYSITKNSTEEIILYYRKQHKILSNIFWLFNHESTRRERSYFIPKVIYILKELLDKNPINVSLGNLNFWCDWGDASEYMGIICEISEKKINEDFILGSGRVENANLYISKLFELYGVDPADAIKDWQDLSLEKSMPPWRLDLSKLTSVIGRKPIKNIYEISSEILQNINKNHDVNL